MVVRSISPTSRGQARALAPELLRALGIRPDGRVLQLAGHFLEPLLLAVVLKETPEGADALPEVFELALELIDFHASDP